VALDWRDSVDITIVITAIAVVAVVSGTIIAGGAIVAVDSIIGVPAVVSIIIFIGRLGAQETSCRWVFLGRLIIVLVFWGGVVPFLGHIIVVVFIFQFPIEEELEVLVVGQGLVVLWPGPEVPLLCVPVQRSACLIGGLGVKLWGHLTTGLRFGGRVGGIRGWGGHGRRRVSRMMQLLSAWGRRWMRGASMRD
jgi:hypothetical protein